MSPTLADLAARLSPGALVTDPAVVEGYRRDRADTAVAGRPLALVRANRVEDVQETLRFATAHRVPVVPRGAGSGLAGGAAAVDGCLLLCLERMRSCEIDAQALVAVAGPGLLNGELKRAAREHGLWYPPDPSSYEICSIGGNLATNAGGLCCVKYGVTTDYVLGLEVVLADEALPKALDAIQKAAKTGRIGDGKIFVSNVEEAVRIRTGETGNDAI